MTATATMPAGTPSATAAATLVSVVLITKDRAALLPRCLASLFALRWRPLELICVDDGSRDDTAATLARLAAAAPAGIAVTVRRHDHNRGIGAARNTGIQAARGAFVAFTDDDCEVRPDWIAALLQPFAADATLAIVGGGIDEPPDRTLAQRASEGINFLGATARRVRSIVGCNMMLEGAFARAFPFDEGARNYADELDRCLTAHAVGRGVWFTPAARVVHHHRHDVRSFLRQQRQRGAGAVWVRHKHRLGLWPRKYWVIAALLVSPGAWTVLPSPAAGGCVLAALLACIGQTVLLDLARGKRWRDLLATLPLVMLGYLGEFAGAVMAMARGRRQ